MKVLFCINKLGSGSGIGGAERLVVDDINEMLKRGISVRLLTFKNESKFSLSSESKLDKKYWSTIHFSTPFNIFAWVKTYQYIKEEKPDVVFSHLWFSNGIIRIICKIAGVRNVISFEHNVYDAVKTEKMYVVDRFLNRWCKKIVAVSNAVKNSLIEHGIDENRIIVIHNGIDIYKYNKKPNPKIKEDLSIPQDAFIFLTIGRLIPQKGIDVLLKAFAKIQNNPHLIIVGSGIEEENLKKLAKELGVESRVSFLGIRHDIPDVLATSNCFILSSRYEGLGIVVLEAMAASKPIIISDFEAGKDMIDNNVSGLIIKRENVEELSSAMMKLMSDVSLRENLSKKAFEKVQEFSIENHVNKILSL